MKKSRFIPIILIPLTLASCSTRNFIDSDDAINHRLKNIAVKNIKTDYRVGDIYQDALSFDITAMYADGTTKDVSSGFTYGVTNLVSDDNYECSYENPIKRAGNYTSTFFVNYKDGDFATSTSVTSHIHFQSVLESGDDVCESLSATMNNVPVPNMIYGNNIDLDITFNWENAGQEIYHLTGLNDEISLQLTKDGLADNVLSSPLVKGGNYVLKINYKGKSTSINFVPALGYKKIENLSILPTDYNNAYAPMVYDSKVLVVPLTLHSDDDPSKSSLLTEWTATKLSDLQYSYNHSFKEYYQHLGVEFTVEVAPVFDVHDNQYSLTKILEQNKPWTRLYKVFENAFDATKQHYGNEFLKAFDTNNDGQIDNIHFVTNYLGTNWGSPLWSHQGFTLNNSGTHDNLSVNLYSTHLINNATNNNNLTHVHEQGHMFGLFDYYDYTNNSDSCINYIGQLDMQSNNCFDWNSYSKLACGVSKPYVVTGYENDFEITINDAATSNECIVVPANYETWNGSAYDEYFVIELFSNKGVNANFWSSYPSIYSVNAGIRIYHVDSRLFDSFNDKEASDNKDDWSNYVILGANNSSDYTALGIGNPAEWGDYKLLTLIQKGGIDTFASSDPSNRHILSSDDLFYEGDSFDFANYRQFLTKSDTVPSSMNNGEIFDWKIDVETINVNSATLRIYK